MVVGEKNNWHSSKKAREKREIIITLRDDDDDRLGIRIKQICSSALPKLIIAKVKKTVRFVLVGGGVPRCQRNRECRERTKRRRSVVFLNSAVNQLSGSKGWLGWSFKKYIYLNEKKEVDKNIIAIKTGRESVIISRFCFGKH